MKSFFFVLSIISCLQSTAQFFEGVVRYDISYVTHTDALTKEQMERSGTLMVYNIKGGNYRFDFLDGKETEWMLYLDSTQKLYSKFFNNDTIYWKEVTTTPDTILNTSVNRGVIELQGRKCDEIIFKVPSGVHKYYFDPRIKIDSRFFLHHKNGNLSDFLKISSSIPLIEIFEWEYGLITSTAAEIIQTKLPDNLFELPANAILLQE